MSFYITTSIMYTNGPPHIGFALELVQADVLARYHRQMGENVRFLTGTDEHGTKIARSAAAAGMEPQAFVDSIAGQVRALADQLAISNDDFIRTTDRERHWPAVERLWGVLADNGDLYKKSYEGYYCVGHEAFIKASELVDGRCPLHKTPTELVREENWFFKLSKYRDQVRKLVWNDDIGIVPATRKQEILNLLEDAEDISFSRPSANLSWGIPVPGDPTQTMYVWADALTNYISALDYGAPDSQQASSAFREFWPANVHLIGKDILRFHAMIWPAMLLAAGLEVPKAIFVHGFINVDGEKMSKTLGNVIDPHELLGRHGAEVARYYLLREIPSTDDGDFSWENVKNRYESDLANGLGNLVQRVATLIRSRAEGEVRYWATMDEAIPALKELLEDRQYHEAVAQFRLHDALGQVWAKIGTANAYVNEQEPWKQEGEALHETLGAVSAMIGHIAWLVQPFMPGTAERISRLFNVPLGEWQDGTRVTPEKPEPLFPRER